MTSATPDLPVRLPSWLRSITSLIIVLFGDRSRCVWAACSGPYSTAQ